MLLRYNASNFLMLIYTHMITSYGLIYQFVIYGDCISRIMNNFALLISGIQCIFDKS